ncbi:MAG: RsmD family RNA methyltransferase [Candidatus Caldarchaeum sp.]
MWTPRSIPLLAGVEAQRILGLKGKKGEAEVSLDIGLTRKPCLVSGDGMFVGKLKVGWRQLEEMAESPEDVFILKRKPQRLSWFDGSYYRMVLPKWGHAPTLEINGIRMHRTVDISPERDALQKVSLLPSLKNSTVLDVCTGLGYTAIAALRRGAYRVVTVEKDPNVLEMASYNPWSRELFDRRVKIVLRDALDFLPRCRMVFDAVVHDPPTIRIAGDLYSLDFYRELHRVLRNGGVLVHYVGQPGVKKGVKIYVGVMERLRMAGFKTRYVPWARCVWAVKV